VQLHHFAVQKHQPEGDIEFVITVKEYVNPPYPTMRFLAQADKQTNQKIAPFTPNGWGSSLFRSAERVHSRNPFVFRTKPPAIRSAALHAW